MLAPLDVRSAASLRAQATDLTLDTRPAAVTTARTGGPRAAGAAAGAASPEGAPVRALATARRPAAAKGGASRPPVAGYASSKPAAKSKSSSSTKSSSRSASGDLAFLKDKNLTIEEKLLRLLGYLNNKWEKEMQEKLDAIGASEAGAKKSSSSSGAKKSGGLLGGLGGLGEVLQSVVAPASAALKTPLVRDILNKVSGPVLAAGVTALGFPELAPIAMKYGPTLVKSATALLSSLEGGSTKSSGSGGASSARSSASTSTSSSAGKALSDADRQTLMLEIQRLQQKQQEMFELVSNVLKANHDGRLSVINNIR